jgi:hypothetical protein
VLNDIAAAKNKNMLNKNFAHGLAGIGFRTSIQLE